MQDRFKFRVWHIPTKTMEYNGLWTGYPNIERKMSDCNFEVMQCTGLSDKNSKLIYEGDIVYKKGNKDHKGNKMFSIVVWCSMYAEFNISDENGLHRMPSNSNNVEVIGNIYENPELLNKEQE